MASALPPVHRAGFECRLDAGADEVDLQQGIFAADGEPALLARFLTGADIRAGAWRAVRDLSQSWSTPGDPLHTGIEELWLELDAAAAHPAEELTLSDLTPSVFVLLRQADSGASLTAARAFLKHALGGEQAGALDEVLRRCARTAPAPARISHVGVMLGRSVPSLRVHVSPIPLHEMERFLSGIGWTGPSREVHRLARALLDHGDLLVTCLDFVADRPVRVGLECFFAHNRGLDPRWRPLLANLARLGLSSPQKSEALLRWPGTLTPLEHPDGWPEDLIVQSLTRPVQLRGLLDRRLSHVKLTCVPGSEVSAKAYFGYGHVWVRPGGPPPPPPRRAPRRPASTLAEAIQAASDRLLAARTQGGWWRDFADRGRPPGAEPDAAHPHSDEWVTAYVAANLAAAPVPGALAAAHDALELLLNRRHGSSGWSYHALVPPDADTTTWVLRLARELNVTHERLAAARQFVERLTDTDGGVSTYPPAAAAPLAEFTKIRGSYAGWCAKHTCVTAAAAVLDITLRSTSYLLSAQRADGSWPAYWWDDDEYTTALAVEALALDGKHSAPVFRAAGWSAGRIGHDGAVRSAAQRGPSPFATALALRAIRRAVARDSTSPVASAASRAERWLLHHQLADGSWESSARLRIPPPAVEDPGRAPELALSYVDENGLFTTAAVLGALLSGVPPRGQRVP